MILRFYKTNVNVNKLISELSVVFIVQAVFQYNDYIDIVFQNELNDAQQQEVAQIVERHTPTPLVDEILYQKLSQAMGFGQKLILEFGVENIKLGVTSHQVKSIISKTQSILSLLNTGALTTALQELMVLPADDILTEERILKYINKIREFLALPPISNREE